jgi:transcriptional regulator with XRE-family HTH domain
MPQPSSEAARLVGERIRAERLRLGLSQDDVAHLAGMNMSNYGKIERGIGNPVLHTMVRIAAVLDIDPAILVAGLGAEHLPPQLEAYSAAEFVAEQKRRSSRG